jgi:uncharacterized protein
LSQDCIHEAILTTADPSGAAHIAPMGVRRLGESLVIAPFRPSRTLDNLMRSRCATINYTDDVRIFAGCLTGRRDWPLVPSERIAVPRLAESLAHCEVELEEIHEDQVRPRLVCRSVWQATHQPFQGFNRARAAVLELAILVSRFDRLPPEKVAQEIAYLQIAIDKTAGPRELVAWGWLMERVSEQRAESTLTGVAATAIEAERTKRVPGAFGGSDQT